MKEGCTNKKSREKKRREREILINPVHRKWSREKGKGKSQGVA